MWNKWNIYLLSLSLSSFLRLLLCVDFLLGDGDLDLTGERFSGDLVFDLEIN